MRRVILGALTIAVGALAAIGIIGRRRWAVRDEALPLEPAPPLGLGAAPAAVGTVGTERALEAGKATPRSSAPSEPRAGKAAGSARAAAARPKAKAPPRPRRKSAAAPAPSATSEGDAAPS